MCAINKGGTARVRHLAVVFGPIQAADQRAGVVAVGVGHGDESWGRHILRPQRNGGHYLAFLEDQRLVVLIAVADAHRFEVVVHFHRPVAARRRVGSQGGAIVGPQQWLLEIKIHAAVEELGPCVIAQPQTAALVHEGDAPRRQAVAAQHLARLRFGAGAEQVGHGEQAWTGMA